MRSKPALKFPAILLVDDDEGYRFLFERAFARSGLRASLQCVADAAQAKLYLSRKGQFRDEKNFPFPSVVLLELKMSGVSGFDLLKWKRRRPELQSVPFVVLSRLDLEENKKKAAELGACDYLVKSISTPHLVDMVLRLEKLCDRRVKERRAKIKISQKRWDKM